MFSLKKASISLLCATVITTGLIFLSMRPSNLASSIDKLMTAYTKRGQFSGTILVAKSGKIILSKGYGMANYELNMPNKPDTKFRLASVTKQFTAMAIVQLQEGGLLSVTDPLSKYIPDFPRGDEISILHLLNHRSGIPNFTGFPEYKTTKSLPTTLEQTIERFKNKPLKFKPGEKYRYSNSGYILLTYIIEKVSGQKYEDYIHEHIFKPTGMTNSGYDHHKTVLQNRASGYGPAKTGIANASYIDMSIPAGAGALYSTVEDLYLWDRALYTQNIASKKAVDEIVHAMVADPVKDEYSYGWILDIFRKHLFMWHNGGIEGFHTHISRYINDDVCIIILSNFVFAPLHKLQRGVAKIVFGQPYKLPKQAIKVDQNIYDDYVGNYQVEKDEAPMKIFKENNQLFVQAGKKQKTYEFFPVSETEFFSPAVNGKITFIKDETGTVNQAIVRRRGKDIVAEKLTP